MAKSNTESFEVLEKIGVSSEVVSSLRQIIETVTKYIDENYNVVYDSAIIRGQGYYTGTGFEVYDDDFGREIGGV